MKTIKGYKVELLAQDTDQSIITTLLANRNIPNTPESIQDFFTPDFSHLHDPFLLPGMSDAVVRILKARENKERIVVFGDYDVDGVSATALLVRFFANHGFQVSYRLPHRVKDGYGLKSYFVDELAEKDVKLIITVDCGTKDIEAIAHARSLGIDMIVTDHHVVPDEIPEGVVAIINPKNLDSSYPFSSLSGSGVAFKLLCAICKDLYPDEKKYIEAIRGYIDFATLGTIADCMPLVGENRTIAYLGLKQLKNSSSCGLRRLIEGVDTTQNMDGDVVGFRIGPRINAAGRMDTPYKALQMLLASEDRLDEIMNEIEDLNVKRKTATEKFAMHAMDHIDERKNVIIYDSTDIEHGIVGLIAGRLCEAFHKPAIALKDEGEKLVASCRSPEYFDIVSFLTEFKEYFVAFGGHKQAAGFTILKSKYREFCKKIESRAAVLSVDRPESKKLVVEAEIDLKEVKLSLAREIKRFQPFGIANPKPLFLLRNISTKNLEYLGKDRKHLRIKDLSTGVSSRAFGFGQYYDQLKANNEISIIAEIEENVWQGRVTVDLNIKDIILS